MQQKLIIKTGEPGRPVRDTLGRFEDWIARESGTDAGAWQVVDVAAGEALPAVATVAGAVITGSLAMVSDRADWSERTAGWLREAHAANVPLLGICFGHQLLAHALGGEVGFRAAGPEAGTVEVTRLSVVTDDPLFAALPSRFAANVFHWQSVLRLPAQAEVLACSAAEPHQAFRLGNSWGVQFHPEFDAVATGRFLALAADELARSGQSAETLAAAVCPTPEAASLLRRFAALLDGRLPA